MNTRSPAEKNICAKRLRPCVAPAVTMRLSLSGGEEKREGEGWNEGTEEEEERVREERWTK